MNGILARKNATVSNHMATEGALINNVGRTTFRQNIQCAGADHTVLPVPSNTQR